MHLSIRQPDVTLMDTSVLFSLLCFVYKSIAVIPALILFKTSGRVTTASRCFM